MPPDHSCPFCSAGASTDSDLRTHLMVEHRKSELARRLAEGVSESESEEDLLRA